MNSINSDFFICIFCYLSSSCLILTLGVLLDVKNDVRENDNGEYDTRTLQLVHAVFRHGQRTPADTYPLDPNINSSWEPFGWGQLTNDGKRNQYELGKFLRKRYSKFLDVTYSPNKVKFQSTDVDRTKMSAQLVAAGAYKPVGAQQWNRNLEWQPIPIHYEPLSDDRLLLVRIECPRYHEEREKIMNSTKVFEELLTYKNLYSYLSTHTGMVIQDPDDVQSIYSTLKAESDYGITLPSWTSRVYPSRLAEVTARSFVLNAYNEEMQKLKGGSLLKQILENINEKISKRSTVQLYAYAGHDSTVSNLLMALGVWDQQIPTYNMLALFELHEATGRQFYIKVFLRNESSMEPYQLRIPGCKDEKCTLKYVLELTANVRPSNLSEECKSVNPGFLSLNAIDRGP